MTKIKGAFMRLNFVFLMTVLSVGCGACGPGGDIGNLLVSGDSISAYSDQLKQSLGPKGWNVRRIAETQVAPLGDNGRNTRYTLAHAKQWVEQNGDNKVIIWNNGMWDASPTSVTQAHVPDGTSANFRTSDEEYRANLIEIAKIYKATGARVIFVTTTQIQNPQDMNFEAGREVVFNQIARSVLPAMGVEICDLYAFTYGHMEWHNNPYDIHYTLQANQQFIGPKMAECVEGGAR